MTLDPKTINLRPVVDSDIDFLLDVYADGRSIELSVVPWSDEQKREFVVFQYSAQTAYYKEHFPQARHDLIVCGDEPSGRSYVNRSNDEIKILDLAVLERHRRKGIGTKIISDLIEEARSNGQKITVAVEYFNPSQNLFKKLGFVTTDSDEMNINLEWRG